MTKTCEKLVPRLLLVVAGVLLHGCGAQESTRHNFRLPTVSSSPADETSGSGGVNESTVTADNINAPRAEYLNGSGVFLNDLKPRNQIQIGDNGGVSLAFRNIDIKIILKAVLADTLGVPYLVDPRVQGNATLETSGTISKEALRISLEALLKTRGYALVAAGDGYNVLPVSDAPASVEAFGQSVPASVDLPGFGVNIIALKYTSPTEMRTVIEPFSPSGGVLLADDSRNVLVLAGTSQEIGSMKHAIETFDVDRMAGMSFGVYRLNYVDADQIVTELENIFKAPGQSYSAPIQFIPISRINRLIAVSANRDSLRTVESWVEKLDIGESAPGRRIYVYHVKNGRAVDLAQTLNAILDTQFNAGQSFAAAGNRRVNQPNANRRINAGVVPTAANQADSFGQAGVRIVPSTENNSLVIMATPSEFAVIESALKRIDKTPQLVLVEVTLADVSLTDELRYGLQWHFEFGNNSVAFGQAAEPTAEFPNFSWSFNNNSSVNAILSALESMTDVKVISAPKILVLNNQSATLQVGDEVPVPTASSVSVNDANAPIVNTIQYRNTGVILTVTPRISSDGLVMIDVEQEVSNVVSTASSGIDAPTIQQRRMTSSVAVQDGSTVALGGLIRSTVSRDNSGVPFLKDIPILGIPFKEGRFVERRSELIVLLTPRVVQNAAQTREVMDYLRKEFQSILGPDETAK